MQDGGPVLVSTFSSFGIYIYKRELFSYSQEETNTFILLKKKIEKKK